MKAFLVLMMLVAVCWAPAGALADPLQTGWSIDRAFGEDGLVTVTAGASQRQEQLWPVGDGTFAVSASYAGGSVIARVDAAGLLSSFGNGGVVRGDEGSRADGVDAAGRILIEGPSGYQRLLPDGTLDAAFHGPAQRGIVSVAPDGGFVIAQPAVDPPYDLRLWGFASDGSPLSWGQAGWVDTYGAPTRALITQDLVIYLAGGTQMFALHRSDGSSDQSFGDALGENVPVSVVQDRGGGRVLAMISFDRMGSRLALLRSDGSPEPSFGDGHYFSLDNRYSLLPAATNRSDEPIWLLNERRDEMRLRRLSPTGTPTARFLIPLPAPGASLRPRVVIGNDLLLTGRTRSGKTFVMAVSLGGAAAGSQPGAAAPKITLGSTRYVHNHDPGKVISHLSVTRVVASGPGSYTGRIQGLGVRRKVRRTLVPGLIPPGYSVRHASFRVHTPWLKPGRYKLLLKSHGLTGGTATAVRIFSVR